MEVFGFAIPLWVGLMIILLALYVTYKYTTSTFHVFENSFGVRGPKPYPLYGTLHLITKNGIARHDIEMTQKYGKLVSTWQGLQPTLIVADVDILKQILVKEFHAFPNRVNRDLGPLGNKMVNILKGEAWKRVRNLLSPTFSTGKLRKMNESIENCCLGLLKNLTSQQGSLNVREYAGAFSMDVIASTLFSLDIDSQSDPNNEFVKMATSVAKGSIGSPRVIIFRYFPMLNSLLFKFGLSVFTGKPLEFFAAIVDKAIAQRKDEDEVRTDFLQLMINAHNDDVTDDNDNNETPTRPDAKALRRRGLSHDELLAQCIIFFLAGFDTIANALTFVCYELAVNPDIQEKLRAAIAENMDMDQNRPTHDKVNKVEYLDMVLSESLRLHTPEARTDRECVEDITINGVFFPKGIHIAVPINILHRDPDVWPDPEKFDPERFSAEAKASRNPYYYLPFGMGPRHCVGMRLALMEIKMAVSFILLSLRIKTGPDTEIPIKRNLTTGRVENCKLAFVEI